MFPHCTCVTHVIAIRCVLVCGDSTGIIDRSGIVAGFRFGCRCRVSAQISCLHGWGGLLQVHMTELLEEKKEDRLFPGRHVYTSQTAEEEVHRPPLILFLT